MVEKKRTREKSCDLRSECRQNADKKFFSSMFDREWEFFVVRQDPKSGKYRGQTVCCEAAFESKEHASKFTPAVGC